jgi:general secretion pathway protein G
VSKLQELDLIKRGDEAKAVGFPGRRVTLFRFGAACRPPRPERGFSLIELVITISVMTILTFSVIPLLKVSVKRQKEQQLRTSLRQMRTAIDEFRRDTVGMQCAGTGGQVVPNPILYVDPRSKVVVSDCTIFGVDNPDRYPPDLETLENGVNVIPRTGASGRGAQGVNATEVGSELSTKKKVYLRRIPIDPMTGEADWDLRSCYDSPDSGSWGGENVFDVRSKSKATSLNGEKYSDW